MRSYRRPTSATDPPRVTVPRRNERCAGSPMVTLPPTFPLYLVVALDPPVASPSDDVPPSTPTAAGGGEMAPRIAAFDWAATPLGPRESWSGSLKTIVEMMLAHALPMTVLWGPESINLYNDAYVPILGDKHPATLGRPQHEVWPELRKVNEPLIRRALAGETITLKDALFVSHRHGASEEAWSDLTLCPLRDDTGTGAGVLVTVFETTGRVLAERERDRVEVALRASEERQAFLLRLSDALRPLAAPTAIAGTACRLLAERLDVDRAYYVEVDEAAGIARVERDYVRGEAPSLAGEHRVADFGWSVAILRRGECHVVPDTRTSSLVPPSDRAACIALGIIACMGAPLIKQRRLVGALCVTLSHPRDWTGSEIELLREVGERIWAAIERAHAEASVRESEARLAAVFESLPVGLGVVDAAGAIILSNPVMQTFLPTGVIPSRDVARRGRWRARDPDGAPVEPGDFPGARALRGESVVPGIEMLHETHDGREIWTSVSSAPIRDGEGRVVGGVIVVTDVDAVKRASEAQRESEVLFRSFAENSADTIWITNRDGSRLEYLSPAFEQMFGAPREVAMAAPGRWNDLILPDDRGMAAAIVPRALAGEMGVVHYRITRPGTGPVVYLRDTGFPIFDEAGTVRRVAGIVQDVTDIHDATAALEAEKERFRTLAEGIPQLVWRSCDEGLWTWASPQWCDYTGQEQEGSHGWGWLEAVHPDDHAVTVTAWHAARPHGELEAEYRVRRASDGAWRWHQTRSVPVRAAPEPGYPEGRILEWLGTTTDIEDLKRLQGQQGILVAELQHRTRNLLAVVRNVAKKSVPPSPGRDQYDARLAALGRVQGFLARTGRYTVALHDLVEAELQAAGDGTSDRVTVDGPPVELPGEGVQPVALALHELATNAVKYGAIAQPEGRLSVTWRAEEREDGSRLLIAWRESGVAMPEGPPTRKGYGFELITRALPYQLKAETRLELAPDGVRCDIALPAGAFRIVEAVA